MNSVSDLLMSESERIVSFQDFWDVVETRDVGKAKSLIDCGSSIELTKVGTKYDVSLSGIDLVLGGEEYYNASCRERAY